MIQANLSPLDKTLALLTAYVANNSVQANELPGIIQDVHDKIVQLSPAELSNELLRQASVADDAMPRPAVPIEQSITDDYIICLEDGRQLRMLKRYLWAQYNLTPNQYRTRWGLPDDYPMSARNLVEKRRAAALHKGLGKRRNARKTTVPSAAGANARKKASK